jgi:hypothetical protein
MQWYSIKLGAFDDQYPGLAFILENTVAAFCIGRLRHSAWYFAEWLSYLRDRSAVRKGRPASDSQLDPPPWRACLFFAFADSLPAVGVVAP